VQCPRRLHRADTVTSNFVGYETRRCAMVLNPRHSEREKREARLMRKHRFVVVPASPVRTALALRAIDLYAAHDAVGHVDRSLCLTLAGTPFELGTPPCNGIATDGQVG
jgi:hypothetical protein